MHFFNNNMCFCFYKPAHDIKFSTKFKLLLLFALTACSSTDTDKKAPITKYWNSPTERPYIDRGIKYYPQIHYNYNAVGYASWYGYDCHNLPTATAVIFDKDLLTAAHRTLPLPCVVIVENLENHKKLKLIVNDRGPFAKTNKRIIDVSQKAAELLGFRKRGSAKVQVTCIPRESQIICVKYGRKPYPLTKIL